MPDFVMRVWIEYDIEYDNGFRETVTVPLGEHLTMPFNGRLVNWRIIPKAAKELTIIR